MSQNAVKSIIKNSFKNYLKELDDIRLEITRESKKKDEQSRKSKSE